MRKILKAFIVGLFLLCCCNISFAQKEDILKKYSRYHTFYSKGRIEMNRENYTQAIMYFDLASVLFPIFHKPYFEVVICAAQMDDYQRLYDFSIKMLLVGMEFPIQPIALKDFPQTDLYKKFMLEQDSIYRIVMQKYDSNFCKAILYLDSLDQANVWRPASQKDTTIFHQFVELCRQYGFPTYYNAGIGLYRKAIGIIQNSAIYGYPNSEDWQKLLRMINKEIEQGHIESGFICLQEDLFLSGQKKPVKYGVWFGSHKSFPNMIFPSVAEMNANREKAGLEGFELYLEELGINMADAMLEIETRKQNINN